MMITENAKPPPSCIQTGPHRVPVPPAVKDERDIVIFGGGLAGLATGYILSQNSRRVCLLEAGPTVGGLSRTVARHGFLFDLGGHRFLTTNKKVEKLVLDLLADEYLVVSRTSKIFMFDKYFDYPLKPANAIFGLGVPTTCRILFDYCKEKLMNCFRTPQLVSLEDWIVSQFGRKMFDIYFKGYSEKVWGISCENISKEWIARRINGLSLYEAIKNALFKVSGRRILTLTDEFYYPQLGIGRISDRFQEEIAKKNEVRTSTRVVQVNHKDFQVTDIIARNGKATYTLAGSDFVSSIPLTTLVQSMQPPPPPEILEAASKLKYRDLVVVAIMLDTDRVTDLTWLYLPGGDIPFGRIHEPKNWSPHMAPASKTHLVVEYFCFQGDAVWNASDEELTALTVRHLEQLDFIKAGEVIDSCVLRERKAYPLFAVGFDEHYGVLIRYLQQFSNLHIVGRGGMFKYYNMDHAIESGVEAAEEILAARC
jgi:protoporphyrinogen oxidase